MGPITRTAALAIIFEISIVLPVAGTEEFADTPPPLPIQIGEHGAADFVNLIFLFDRVATQSSSVTSPDYRERISQPSSPFYPDYLEYRSGRIDRRELVRRLPHVSMIGDSLSLNFYVSAPWSVFWRARTERRKNWFLDTDPAPESIFSIYERLQQFIPLVATEYSGAGALVAPSRAQEGLRRKIVRTRNLSGQTRRIVGKDRLPDMIMIWIGHNNIDWVEGLSSAEREHPEAHLRKMATRFGKNYTESLQLLINRAKTENHKVGIVVFGMANFEAFSRGHLKAAALHARNPKLYPRLESGYRAFESLKPVYHKTTIRVGLMMETEIQAMVRNLNRELKNYPNIRLQYSEALKNVDFSRLELISSVDGWHPSVDGQKALAEAAYSGLHPTLDFLGINPPRKASLPR